MVQEGRRRLSQSTKESLGEMMVSLAPKIDLEFGEKIAATHDCVVSFTGLSLIIGDAVSFCSRRLLYGNLVGEQTARARAGQ